MDFVAVDREDQRYGIEVKTGDNPARSLKYYRDKGLVDRAVRALPGRGGHGERMDTIPIYLIGQGFPYAESKEKRGNLGAAACLTAAFYHEEIKNGGIKDYGVCKGQQYRAESCKAVGRFKKVCSRWQYCNG